MNERLDQHEKIGLFFSGGKDSLACVILLRDYLDRITIYHNDTGDSLPEMREVIAYVESFAPHFVRIETDVGAWIEQHGLPTDLLPHSSHPVGQSMGEHKTRLVARYDCCYYNLMLPQWMRARLDGCTMVIRGTKKCDMAKLPVADGAISDGVELYYPIQDWSDEQVFQFLRFAGVKPARIYQHIEHGLDCATCPAWWSEKRGPYLKQFHPELFKRYDARLQCIIEEVAPVLANLKREAGVT